MNELKVFENPEFGRVRTVSVDNEPWFFAEDVCDALSIATGVNRITRTTKVTGKGQVYFVNKFLNGNKAVLE